MLPTLELSKIYQMYPYGSTKAPYFLWSLLLSGSCPFCIYAITFQKLSDVLKNFIFFDIYINSAPQLGKKGPNCQN